MPEIGTASVARRNERREDKRTWSICAPGSCCARLLALDGECYFTFSCASTFIWLTTSIRPTTSPKLLWTGARIDIQPGLLVTVTCCPVFNTVFICGAISP